MRMVTIIMRLVFISLDSHTSLIPSYMLVVNPDDAYEVDTAYYEISSVAKYSLLPPYVYVT